MTESSFSRYQRYNALDCAMTLAIFETLNPQLDNLRGATYALSKDLQGPALEMMLRGLRLDEAKAKEKIEKFSQEKFILFSHLQRFSSALGRDSFNPNSWQQVLELLHDRLPIKPILKRKKDGTYAPSSDRESLEKLMEMEGGAAAYLIHTILEYRDRKKSLETLNMRRSPDGRWRCTIKISGTTTGRRSTSEDSFGNGGNLQNLHEDIKEIVIADPGMILICADLSQADSWNIGISIWAATGDEVFLNAVQSGDIHTKTAMLAWPELPWTSDMKINKEIAEEPYYRHHTYRFMCKKVNHGTAYGATYKALSRALRIPEKVAMEIFQRYRSAYPALFQWQKLVWEELQLQGYLISLLNRKRYFLGRLSDASTLREAVAFLGSSPTSDIVSKALIPLHQNPRIALLMDEHDSILSQVPSSEVESHLPTIWSAFQTPIEVKDRRFFIPVELKIGQNWGPHSPQNPLGCKKHPYQGVPSGINHR